MADISSNDLPAKWNELVAAARLARSNAYAKYSGYQVGAAALTASGRIFAGCNVENASYGLTVCAERAAICAAIADGHKDFVAVCVSLTGQPVPCGACRQFLFEFNPDMMVLLDNVDRDESAPPEVVCLSELLPRGFHLEQ